MSARRREMHGVLQEDGAPKGSPAVGRRGESVLVCQILGAFSNVLSSALPVREISRLVDANPGSVHRALATMVNQRVLLRTADGLYRLGPIVEGMAIAISGEDRFVTINRHVQQLRDATGETASLTELRDGVKIITHQAESNSELRMSLPIGKPLPITGSISDKLFYAYGGAEVFAGPLPERLTALSPEDLTLIRDSGYVISEGTIALGTITIGAEVREGPAVTVLSIVGPDTRMKAQGIDFHVAKLRAAAKDLEIALAVR